VLSVAGDSVLMSRCYHLFVQVNLQNEIMDTHEDYEALRGSKGTVKMKEKTQIAKDEKGISKLVTEPYYPPRGSLMLASEFIPYDPVFMNTDIVEYNPQTGFVSYVTDSPSQVKQKQAGTTTLHLPTKPYTQQQQQQAVATVGHKGQTPQRQSYQYIGTLQEAPKH
jgi:hypothetical protein